MFDWFWEFLYSISEILFEIIDGLMSIANMLCGIEPVTVNGEKTDFLSFLLNHDKIMYGFIGAVFVGIFLIMVFSVFQMIKSVKGKTEESPLRIAIKVFKTLGIFLFVPIVMILFTTLVNELMIILYKATSMGADSMGDFLFKAFLPDGIDASNAFVDYRNVDSVDAFMGTHGYDLKKYRFFFSWLCCIPLLFALAKGLLNFVDRTISIVLLFISSPISISSSIVDDGAHFKLWREQVLIKFLTGYGIIIGLNVYILIVSILSSSSVIFFDNKFLNFLFKVAFILGGAISLERVMALVGNLVSSGAGSNELRDAATAYAGMKNFAGGVKDMVKEGIKKLPISKGGSYSKEKIGGPTGSKANNSAAKGGTSSPQGSGEQKEVGKHVLDAIEGKNDDKKSDNNAQNIINNNDSKPVSAVNDNTQSKLTEKEIRDKNFKALFGEDPQPEPKK